MFIRIAVLILALAATAQPAQSQSDPMDVLRRGLERTLPPNPAPAGPAAGPSPAVPRPQDAFFGDQFNFPGIPQAILRGQLDRIPDDLETRALVISYFRVINEVCGEQSTSLITEALQYGSPQFRELRGNPFGPMISFLEAIARLHRDDDIGGFIEGQVRRNRVFRAEGIADARQLIGAIGCSGPTFNAFVQNYQRLIRARARAEPGEADPVRDAALMSPAYRARHNIPDPAVLLWNREMTRASSAAEEACAREYRDGAFCRCTVETLRRLTNSLEHVQAAARSFNDIVSLPVDLRALREGVGACARAGG